MQIPSWVRSNLNGDNITARLRAFNDWRDVFVVELSTLMLMLGFLAGTVSLFSSQINLTSQAWFSVVWAVIQAVAIDGLFFSVWTRVGRLEWTRRAAFHNSALIFIGILLAVVASLVNNILTYQEVNHAASVSQVMSQLHIDESTFSYGRSTLVVAISILVALVGREKGPSVKELQATIDQFTEEQRAMTEELRMTKEQGVAELQATIERSANELRAMKEQHSSELQATVARYEAEKQAFVVSYQAQIEQRTEELRSTQERLQVVIEQHVSELRSVKEGYVRELQAVGVAYEAERQSLAAGYQAQIDQLAEQMRAMEDQALADQRSLSVQVPESPSVGGKLLHVDFGRATGYVDQAAESHSDSPGDGGYVAADDGTTIAISNGSGQTMIATGSHRDRIKQAMLQAILEKREINYKDIANAANVGYSTVKKHASEIRRELGLLTEGGN